MRVAHSALFLRRTNEKCFSFPAFRYLDFLREEHEAFLSHPATHDSR
jgi:hypothetical protein